MSRNLLVLVAFALVCIILTPLYKDQQFTFKEPRPTPVLLKQEVVLKTSNPKNVILMCDSFLPITFAGSELSAYETIKYLRSRGHNVSVYVKTHKVDQYDKFPIYKYDPNDAECRETIINTDVVLFQMSNGHESMEVIKLRSKMSYLFIHMVNSYDWLLQQRVSFPVTIVYNSHMTQDTLPTLYDNMRMVPYVDTTKLVMNRQYTVQNDVVTLINCNQNKGGELLVEIANKMPNVQFLGIKGGYSNQIIEKEKPKNLSYMDNQKDINVVLRKTGILIMPSKNETWGRTAVEAMASGIPVIHSEAPGLVECVGGAGIQCHRNDVDEWCQAINRIIGDRAVREHHRQAGFKRVREIEAEQVRGRQEFAAKIERTE
jgi:glycosyltransferase involved in cell wall biosynthesis